MAKLLWGGLGVGTGERIGKNRHHQDYSRRANGDHGQDQFGFGGRSPVCHDLILGEWDSDSTQHPPNIDPLVERQRYRRSVDEQEPSETTRGRQLLFLDRPLQPLSRPWVTPQGELDEEALEDWATSLAECLWPVIEQVRRQAGEAVDSEPSPPVG